MPYQLNYTWRDNVPGREQTEYSELQPTRDAVLSDIEALKQKGFTSSCVFHLNGDITLRFNKSSYSYYEEIASIETEITGTAIKLP